ANSPAVPGSGNNAADIATTIGAGVSVTRSSVYYDYATDNAYVGDDGGLLHKFTGVFFGTPTEAGSPWPVTIAASTILTTPLYDPVSQNIYIGSSNGTLYRVVASTGAVTSVAVGAGGTYGGIVDAPIVDGSTGYVFAAAGELASTYSCSNSGGGVVQENEGFTSTAHECLGIGDVNNAHCGAFDNAYFTSVSTGHMYWVGNDATYGVPALWYLGFNSSGTVTSATEATSSSPATPVILASVAEDASPLTEIYNTYSSTDWLFGTVPGSSCGGATSGGCILSFNITTPPTIGPWLPNWSHYALNSQTVDTNGNIQQATGPGVYATGEIDFSALPADWYYEGYYTNLAYYSGFGFNVGDFNPGNGASPYLFADNGDYDFFYCPGGYGTDAANASNPYFFIYYSTCVQIFRGNTLAQAMQNTAVAINFSGSCAAVSSGHGTCNDISTSYGGAANPYIMATGYTSNSVLLRARSVGTAPNGAYCWYTGDSGNYANITNSGSCLSGGQSPPGPTGPTPPAWSMTSGGTATDGIAPITWANKGASNGQTTAVQATGT